jgi:hypothetical protein
VVVGGSFRIGDYPREHFQLSPEELLERLLLGRFLQFVGRLGRQQQLGLICPVS